MRVYKDSEGNIYTVNVVISFEAPEDWTLIAEEVASEDLPMRKYRDAWIDDEAGGVKVDLAKAREMKLEEIREQRNAMLKRSDERYVEELSKGNDTTAIEADKAALRDLPSAAETALSSKIKANTIDEYDAFADLTLSEEY